MIGFARETWSSLYSEVPEGFKRLALVLSALSGINLLIIFTTNSEFKKIFEGVPFLIVALLIGFAIALSWFCFVALSWLWLTRKLSPVIRWGTLLVILWPVAHLVVRHSIRAASGKDNIGLASLGCGLAFSGFVGIALMFIMVVVGWVKAGGFSQDEQSRHKNWNDRTRSQERSRHESELDHHYAVLGVTPAASIEEIKAAYRSKMKQYHPDRVANLGPKLRRVAEEESKAITSAYAILMAGRS